MKFTLRNSLFVLFLCFLSTVVFSQTLMDGAIVGTVVDPTNAVVTNATVTVVNTATNQTSTAPTDTTGGYRVLHLQPGTYKVTVSAPGFTNFVAENMIVEVGRPTPLEVRLSVGGRAETVMVSGEAPVLNPVQADFSTNINTTSLDDLPIFARRWSTYAMSTPGAVADGTYGLVAFRGISGLLNNNTVDGGDNNNAYFSEERGRTRITATVSQDSVREFQVNNSNFSAEYGRAAGGVVNAITKSGTNNFHGSGHLYATDSAMWAYNPFSLQSVNVNGVITPELLKPPDRRWQFGANLGGPIVKDKLFFFFNWDQQKENAPGVAAPGPTFWVDPATNGPITAATATNCNPSTTGNNLTIGQILWCRFNRVIVPSGKTPVAPPASPTVSAATAQGYIDNSMNFLGGLTGTRDRNKDQYILFPKIDWRINDKHTLTGTWNHMRWNSLNGVQTAAVVGRADWGDDFVDVDTVNGRLMSLLSNTFTNEFRTSIGRENQYETINNLQPGEPTTGPGGMSPEINISAGGTSFVFGRPYYTQRYANPLENRLQFTDIMTYAYRNHMFKWGVDVNRSHDKIDYLYQQGGVYYFNTIQDWISDNVTPSGLCTINAGTSTKPNYVLGPCYSTFSQGVGPTAYDFATTDYSIFAQDEWHVARRVTLNLGLRWEYEQLPMTIWPNNNLPQSNAHPSDPFDFGPRVGVAVDLTGDGKTVLRGGYGIYYSRMINAYIGGIITNTGSPNSQISTGSLNPCAAGPTCTSPLYPQVFSGVAAVPKPAPSVWGNTVHAPMVNQMDLVLEREIAHNTVVSGAVLMTMGYRLPFMYDANIAPATRTTTYTVNGGPDNGQTFTFPFYTTRLNPNFNQIYALNYNAESRYTGWVLQLNRRMSKGLQIQTSYTHGRATDTNQMVGTGSTTNQPLDPYNLAGENGASVFDIRHRVSFMGVYQPEISGKSVASKVVNGFSISPMFNIISGSPQNYSISGNAPSGRVGSGILGAGGTNRWPLIPRDAYLGPTVGGANLRVSRRFQVTEGKHLEFMGDVFNITNHLFPTAISSTLYQINGTTLNYCGVSATPTGCTAGMVGTVTNGNNQDRIGNTPRQWQVGARFDF